VFGASSSVWDCMLIRRSANMLAENLDCAWPGCKKELGSNRLNRSPALIRIMRSVQSIKDLGSRFCVATFTCWKPYKYCSKAGSYRGAHVI
jgi:hypothetical protein